MAPIPLTVCAFAHVPACDLLTCSHWSCTRCGDLTPACVPCDDPDGRCGVCAVRERG